MKISLKKNSYSIFFWLATICFLAITIHSIFLPNPNLQTATKVCSIYIGFWFFYQKGKEKGAKERSQELHRLEKAIRG